MSGQRSWLCCTFASWFDSLSSAATSVAAKPNHGFFSCQHPCHVFPDRFPAPRRGVADECSAPTRRRCVAPRVPDTCPVRKSTRNKVFSAKSVLAAAHRPEERRGG